MQGTMSHDRKERKLEKKTSVFENGLIWFGASVSIAELLTGTSFAGMGAARGMAAIIIGHVIGCTLMFLAGIIGARTGSSAMGTVRISFGRYGASFFALMNVLQLVGWTAVMTGQGADAAASAGGPGVFESRSLWVIVIGVLILAAVLIGVTHIGKLNVVVMGLLFVLTVILSVVVFGGGASFSKGSGALSFGAAVELAAAMPVSWLPLISDYTRTAERALPATLVSVITYGLGSCWMFIIGMAAAELVPSGSIAEIMLKAGLGAAGLLIVVLSTVTTTFLDAFSGGVSAAGIYDKINEKAAAAVVTAVGTLISLFVPDSFYENFLYLIGSVFVPMISVLAADYFINRNDSSARPVNWANFVIWAAGFIIYRIFMNIDTPVGSTLPVVVIVVIMCVIVNAAAKGINGKREK